MSGLSNPLNVLLEGPHKEARELRVLWRDVDEKTFVRFVQWAYTRTYTTADPEISIEQSNVEDGSNRPDIAEQPLYNLGSIATSRKPATTATTTHCQNPHCRRMAYSGGQKLINAMCSACGISYQGKRCSYCYQNLHSECEQCRNSKTKKRRLDLVNKFLNTAGVSDPVPSSGQSPEKNTKGCEDYSGVFLCHAKLYVLGDTYDIPQLCQLSLHRLHATLKDFTLYPSRLDDISVLARYVFENTRPNDKIQEMITLYYACIIEDASKHEGLKSLIDECPDFAYELILRMSERLD